MGSTTSAAVRRPLLSGVRGRGLWLALVDRRRAPLRPSRQRRGEHGFLVNAIGPDAVRLAPPLVLSEAEADSFTAALPAILDAAQAAD